MNAPAVSKANGKHALVLEAVANEIPPEQWRLDLEAAANDIAALVSLERPPTPEEASALARKVRDAGVQSTAPAILTRPDLSAICKSLPGKYKRIATHFEPLDLWSGGGLQTGRIMVIGGEPGVTKTGFTLYLLTQIAYRGVMVNGLHHEVLADFVATDEPRDGLLSRMAQMEGLSRADLENEDITISGPAWEHAQRAAQEIPNLTIWDPREDKGASVEAVARDLAARSKASGVRAIMAVDSLQTAPFEVDDPALSIRERIDGRMRTLRALAIQHGICFVVVSELNRGATRPGSVLSLAAFKESSGIEYGVDVAIILTRPGEPGVIQAEVFKNRLGETNVAFRMERTKRCMFIPIAMPDETERAEDAQRSEAAEVSAIEQEIIRQILTRKKAPTCRTDLMALASARNELKSRAITNLLTRGAIEGGRGKPYRIVAAGLEES